MAFGEVSKRARDLDQDGQPDSGGQYIIWIALTVVVVLFFFWSTFFVSAIFSFSVLPLGGSFTGLPAGILGLLQNPGNPRAGWPESFQHEIAPALIYYPVMIGLIFFWIKAFKFILRVVKRIRSPKKKGARWAEDADLGEIIDPRDNLATKLIMQITKSSMPDGVILGETKDSGRVVRLQRQNHALIVAGTRSGKTAGLCTPALLTYDGAVIATSVKDDLVKDTIKERRRRGKVFVFDPTRLLAPPEDEEERARREAKGETFIDDTQVSYWSPLDMCGEWREAQRVASVLIETSLSKGGGDSGNMTFFLNHGKKLLSPLMFAAASMDEPIMRVTKWLDNVNSRETHAEVDAILRWTENIDALDAWIGFLGRPEKLRGDIAATVEAALTAYADPKVQETAITATCPEGQHLTPEELFNGDQNTLYIVAPMSEQGRLEPLFVTLIQGFLTWVSDLPYNLNTPCIAVLDEAANIAALPQLPNFLSAIGSKGVSIITAWQDFSQIKGRYKDQMDTVLGNSRGKIILSGISDRETLAYFKTVAGESVEENVSVSRAEKDAQNRNFSISEQRRALLDEDTVRTQKFGEGILLYGNMPPLRIKLRMFFLDNKLRAKVGLPLIPKWKIILRKIPALENIIKV